MNKQIYIVIAVVVIILIGGGIYISSTKKDDNKVASDSMMKNEEDRMQNKGTKEDEIKDKAKNEMMSEDKTPSSDKMMSKSGSYQDYSEATVKSEQAADHKVVLFFHAPWCPFCKAADAAFKTSLDKIPSGVTVLKTDYDSNKDLKTKYGITYQHTFVQIDNNGNQVTKWNGGDIDNLIKYLK